MKIAEAVSVGTEMWSLPQAATICGPEDEGTVKVQEKAPAAEVVCDVQVWVAGVIPP